MIQLLLMRHAKSDWSNGLISDFDRPLNARGLRAAPRMAKEMRLRGLLPDCLLVSEARRAMMTAELILGEWKENSETSESLALPRMHVMKALYHSDPETIFTCVRAVMEPSDRRVMVVAHNPGLEEMLDGVCKVFTAFPTGALAIVELSRESLEEGDSPRGTFVEMIKPRELDGE